MRNDAGSLKIFGALNLATGGPGTTEPNLDGGVIPLNAWSHLAATYDGTVMRFYVNGTLVTSQTLNYSILTGTGVLALAQKPEGSHIMCAIGE